MLNVRRSLRRRLFAVFSSMLIVIAWSTVLAIPTPVARATDAPVANVYAFGDASFYGSTGALALTKPIVGIAATPSGRGYWLVANDGGIFSFGDAPFFGSTGAIRLNQPIVGMAATPSGNGYLLVASDGGIFAFGDAAFFGSTGAVALNRPIVGMAATPSGRGYWFVASDGGIFSFGDAGFYGSTAGTPLDGPIVGMANTPSGHGYWLAGSDGHVFERGDATSTPGLSAGTLSGESIVGVAASPERAGFWLAANGDPHASVKAEAAIAWFEARIGSSAYEERCETAVENAYRTSGAYPTAHDNWLARPDKHLDWQNAPRGALVFYNTSSSGHVAISLGNGYVVSTSINRRIAVAPIGFLQNPLGWAAEPW